MQEYENDNNGYKYILNVIECHSKFAWSYPCVSKTADEVYFHLENLFYNCYVPKELQSDNGLEFRNNKIASLCHTFKIRQVFGRPYHPESQGQVERFNFTLKRMLLSVMSANNSRRWHVVLHKIVYEYNIKLNRSINNTPVKVMLNYNGFNVEANLYNNEITPHFFELTLEEIQEIDDFRYQYYHELSRNVRRRVRRHGLNIPRIDDRMKLIKGKIYFFR